MAFSKNDMIQLSITDIGLDGEGIGKIEGFTVFVKDTVPGDRVEAKLVKVKKHYAYARLCQILTPSPDRILPRCPVAGPCGGCQIQSLSYQSQLALKEKKVFQNLERIGGMDLSQVQVEPILSMEYPWQYRNKAQFPIRKNKEGRTVAGFYAGRTHSVIETEDCAIGIAENKDILQIVLNHMDVFHITPYKEETGEGLVRHLLIRKGFATGELMVCLVLNGTSLPGAEKLVGTLQKIPGMSSITLNINTEKTNVILGQRLRLLWGKPYIQDRLGGLTFQISPLSFFQVNPVQTKKLYGKVLEYAALTGTETVWDLYCGIGTISLTLAREAREVYGVEIIPQAVENARTNARLNGITNASFYVGKAEEVLPREYREKGLSADIIVVDPPRKGCEASLLDLILQMRPNKVIYVSCDSATLSRDLALLKSSYRLEKICPCDMFPQTTHVETVCLLGRRKPDDTIKVSLNMDDYYQIRDAEEEEKNPS